MYFNSRTLETKPLRVKRSKVLEGIRLYMGLLVQALVYMFSVLGFGLTLNFILTIIEK